MSRSFFSHPMAKWGLFMGFLFALWFGGWFAFARYADGKIGEQITAVSEQGVNIDCQNRAIRGFPFRIGVFCDDLNISHNRDVFRFELGELRTAAQLYSPGTVIAELDGPFKTWQGTREITARWNQMRLFLDANLTGGFELASLNFGAFAGEAGGSDIDIENGAVHFRPTPVAEGAEKPDPVSLDGYVTFDNFALSNPKLEIPPASLKIDATLVDGYTDLISRGQKLDTILRDGAEINLSTLLLSLPEGGRLAFSGPLTIDENGLVSGNVKIGIADPKAIGAWAKKVDQRLQQAVSGIGQAVAGMGKADTIDGQEMRTIVVTLDQGVLRLGFIQLARIPPLFQN